MCKEAVEAGEVWPWRLGGCVWASAECGLRIVLGIQVKVDWEDEWKGRG